MWEWRMVPCILKLSTRWKREVSFMHQILNPWGKNPSTPLIGGWVGPRASLDVVAKRKKSLLLPQIPVIHHVGYSI
jgi:hypothetical protein